MKGTETIIVDPTTGEPRFADRLDDLLAAIEAYANGGKRARRDIDAIIAELREQAADRDRGPIDWDQHLDDEILSIYEVCAWLGYHPATIRRWELPRVAFPKRPPHYRAGDIKAAAKPRAARSRVA